MNLNAFDFGHSNARLQCGHAAVSHVPITHLLSQPHPAYNAVLARLTIDAGTSECPLMSFTPLSSALASIMEWTAPHVPLLQAGLSIPPCS